MAGDGWLRQGRQNCRCEAPVIGRERVLAELGGLLATARAGTGSVVVLTGEAGIGKSTVADALVERARSEGVPVLIGRAVADEGAPAYWPWRRALAAPDVGLAEDLLDVDASAGERRPRPRRRPGFSSATERDGPSPPPPSQPAWSC